MCVPEMSEAVFNRLERSGAVGFLLRQADHLLIEFEQIGEDDGQATKAFEQKFRDFMYLLRSKSRMWKPAVLVDMLSYICGRYPKVKFETFRIYVRFA